jgi:hypothetical protein
MSGYRGSGMFYNLGQFLENSKDSAQRTAQGLADRANDAGTRAESSINTASGAGVSDAERERQANLFQGMLRPQWDAEQAKLKANAFRDTAAAEGQIQNMGNFSGLQQLLGQGQQNYTPGMSRLDAFALGANPEAQATINSTQQRWGGLRGMLNQGMARGEPPMWKPPEPPGPTKGPIDPTTGHPGGPATSSPIPPPPPIPPSRRFGGRTGRKGG